MKKKRKTCKFTGISSALRSQLCYALRVRNNIKKASPALVLLGCSIDDFAAYLEAKFLSGMTWENRGQWHIDHIRPCASFDLEDESQQRECFHFTNM